MDGGVSFVYLVVHGLKKGSFGFSSVCSNLLNLLLHIDEEGSGFFNYLRPNLGLGSVSKKFSIPDVSCPLFD